MFSKSLFAGLFALATLGSATKIHVTSGCIVVGSSPICQNSGAPVVVNSGSVTIYGRFDGNTTPYEVNSGCTLKATWPTNYGDIYYGADNCLYDSNGQNINGQCCTSGQTWVRNPYNFYFG